MLSLVPGSKLHRVRSRHVVTPSGVLDAVVEVEAGRIAGVHPASNTPLAGAEDLGDLWLLPGLVDTHVHINDPGRADWEGFETATRAAAAGGVTTLVDMPLNSIPATCSVEALEAKRAAARGRCLVDVAFWGGVVSGNAESLEPLALAGVRGFKCFLSPSGVDEFPNVGEADLREAMPAIARLGLPLLVHAEWPALLDGGAAPPMARGGDPRAYATWLASRPPAAEVAAIDLLIRLSGETGCRVHVVHLSAAEAVPLLQEARDGWLPITVETCPHYLVFDSEAIPDGATAFKCAPPIRDHANREALWEALRAGDIDLVATDHSPCPPELKRPAEGDFMTAWGGIASLELSLAAIWTEGVAREVSLEDVAWWMSGAPARLAGFEGRKGAIEAGHDADLVAFDPDARWEVDAGRLHQRHAVSPYAGRAMRGSVTATWLRGGMVYREGDFASDRTGRIGLDGSGAFR